MTREPLFIDIETADLGDLESLLSDVAHEFKSVEAEEFQGKATDYAQDLPRPLRGGLNHFRLAEPSSFCVIRGFPVDQRRIGATPAHWSEAADVRTTHREELFIFLCACLLGDPIAWSTKQDGRILHDILPIKETENEQLASSSRTALTWHTEDAFHPLRADYLGLLCLRNPTSAGTMVGSVTRLDLPEQQLRILREPRFTILPDTSHLSSIGRTTGPRIPAELERRARARIERMLNDPEPVPLLFGDPEAPYFRMDQFYARAVAGDAPAAAALEALRESIDANLSRCVLGPGHLCFIDNYRAVHGRESFTARYDGTDRWLKRVNVTRDLRDSREWRTSAPARMII